MNFHKTILALGFAVMLSLGLTTTVSATDHWNKPPQHHHAYYLPHHQPQIIHEHNGKHHQYQPYYPQYYGYHNKNCHCPSCHKHGYGKNNVSTIKVGNVWISIGHGYKKW
jgi:hypothetical protein